MIESGTEAFLRQAYRNNWQRYLSSLRPGARSGWDICVLTANDEPQAEMYRKQLFLRREAELLPARTRFVVIADPDGQRIGSGGATLRVLRMLQASNADPAHSVAERDSVLTAGRVLIIHSGGDSRRLPHCSAIGKLFARVPRTLPDGRSSTLFDEFLISLSGIAIEVPPGVLVASGDVLLLFDHLQLALQQPGVTGVAAAAPAEMGTHHGVYVSDGERRLRAYLHKPTAGQLRQWNALSDSGTVDIDTGLVWFDADTVQRIERLALEPAVAAFCGDRAADVPLAAGLNLYGDLLLPLAQPTTLEGYLSDTSDGPATPAVREARQVIWQHLRGVPFAVERLQPAAFLHFGTSREYWQLVADSPTLARACGWSPHAASWIAQAAQPGSDSWVTISAMIEEPISVATEPVLIIDSRTRGPLTAKGPALLVGLSTDQPLAVETGVVVHQLPLPDGFVTRVYGLDDDPKHPFDVPTATMMNRPWSAWLAEAGVDPDTIWPDLPDQARTLWNARLYPVAKDRDESLALSLPLQSPAFAPADWLERWQHSHRLSLAESFARAAGDQILAELALIDDEIAVRRFHAAVEAEQPTAEARSLLGSQPETIARRTEQAASRLQADDPIMRLRGYQALAAATGDSAWEDRAFRVLAAMIEETVGSLRSRTITLPCLGRDGEHATRAPKHRHSTHADGGVVRVEAAARIDFGGGWTDTPPYSIERGGTVLNAAITLKGQYPIVVEAEWMAAPGLTLESCDIGSAIEPAHLGEVLAFTNPADPFALLKAAVVLRGIVPADGDPKLPLAEVLRDRGGVRLCTQTDIPRGSGLGTSSIIAGAVLACLARLLDIDLAEDQLFDEVLYLEQMMTTGGGWQDQVGGLTGGIKLVTTAPGLPQRIRVIPATLQPDTKAELAQRLLLVYTGQQRLAKNLLRAVMSRWMARDPEMVWIQGEIARLAIAMRDALEMGDIDGFGALLTEHWALNVRMDPGCTNPFIDELFETMAPFIYGGKLAGAGGGGFAIVIARDEEAAERLDATLAERYAGTATAVWPCAVPDRGMVCIQAQGPGTP